MESRVKRTLAGSEQRIKELEVQIKLARKKTQLFEAVVEVLKKDYGVSIVKKPSGQVLTQKLVQGLSVAGACRHLIVSGHLTTPLSGTA